MGGTLLTSFHLKERTVKVTRARYRKPPKLCCQCGTPLPPPDAKDEIRCVNIATCGADPIFPQASQVVAAVLQPVRMRDGRLGLVYVQHIGRDDWELPAGFNPVGECSKDCGARETEEEATVSPDADGAIAVDFETVPEGHGCVFHLYPEIPEDSLPAFVVNDEKQDRKIGFDWRELRHSTHGDRAREFFAGRFDRWPARVPAL